jgi:bacterioferritin-associated ferredoxin
MYVCVCHAVTDQQICKAARAGVTTVNQLTAQSGLGSNCGCCRESAQKLLDTCHASSVEAEYTAVREIV